MTDGVPLICDPVPGPIIYRLSRVEAQRLRFMAWDWPFAWIQATVHHERSRVRPPRAGQRTEWPDAEFCAA